jgi:arylsulfatase A-like enzyme
MLRISFLIAMLILAFCPASFAAPQDNRPNILFILADDLGWGDVGFHGGKIPTPNLDKLAPRSLELAQHYVYPVCSPTRASFLSGRYASRFGVTTPQNERAYPWDTVTLARALKSRGYDTALTGKWHLGSRPDWGPPKFGFDHSYGSLAGGVGPWDHRYKTGEYSRTWHRDGVLIEEQGHVTDLITHEAIEWLQSRGDRPFFLYVPFTTVHIPIREPDEILKRVPKEITEPSRREYAADVMHLDESVGKLLDALAKTGKAGNTLVIFTSDNGALPDAKNDDKQYPDDHYTPGPAGGSNFPLRGVKGQVYEGGIRVPTLAYWPGRLKPGVFNSPAHISDWMPTFCALAGYQPEKDLHWDGQNLWPALSGAAPPAPRTIYVAGPGFRAEAFRDGDWKLIVQQGKAKKGEKAAAEKVELYNLAKDPNETDDLSAKMPEQATALRCKLTEAARANRDAVAKD